MKARLFSCSDAKTLLSRVLAGAVLESILAHSLQVNLRFLSDHISSGNLTLIEIGFTCQASVGTISNGAATESDVDGRERSNFLASAHRLIGTAIKKVELDRLGNADFHMSDRCIRLALDDVDLQSDEWVWAVFVKDGQTFEGGGASLGCFPENGEVEFYLLE